MVISIKYNSNLELSICLSLITAQSLEIVDIAISKGGLTSSQKSLIDLLDKISNGTTFNINDTGCRLRIIPGTLIGGEIDHDCDPESSIGYYAMYLIMLAPFCKKAIEANLRGVTNCENNISIECLNYGLTEVLKEIVGVASLFELTIKQRGAFPNGGGLVILKTRPVQSLKPLHNTKIGKIQKVRGTSWTTRVNPTMGKRLIDGAKADITKLLSDVYIINDHRKGIDSGASPGYGITLVATTTEQVSYCVDVCSSVTNAAEMSPENLGKYASELLCEQIVRGGIVSSQFEPIVLALLALGLKNASKFVLGLPSMTTIQAIRDIYEFTRVKFAIVQMNSSMEGYRGDNCGKQFEYSCIGSGLVNLNRDIRRFFGRFSDPTQNSNT